MNVRDVAAYLSTDEKTSYCLAEKGNLPGSKVAATWRFKKDDIDRWIEEGKAPSGTTPTGRRVTHGARRVGGR